MARDFGQIKSAYWTHPEIRGLTLAAKTVGAYLMTGPHSNGLGCFYCPPGYVADDLKIAYEDAVTALSELSGVGFVKRCTETGYVLIPHYLKWNSVDNPNVAKARAKELGAVPMQFSHHVDLIEAIDRFGGEHLTVTETLRQRVHETGSNSDPTGTDRNRTVPQGKGTGSVAIGRAENGSACVGALADASTSLHAHDGPAEVPREFAHSEKLTAAWKAAEEAKRDQQVE